MSLQKLLNGRPLGILCAMPEEVAEYLKHFENSETETISGVVFYRGEVGPFSVVLAQCGVGKVHAAVSTQSLILKYQVGAVLFSGVAGALEPNLDIGDVVISKDALQHDMDLEPLGFEPGLIPWTPWKEMESDSVLIKMANESAKNVGLKSMIGRVVSGDQFVADPERVKVLRDYFKGDCVEMEAGAVGQVCAMNGNLPWVTIRAISDKADHSSPVDFPKFCEVAAVKSYELVADMLS